MGKSKTQAGLLKAVSTLSPGERSETLYDQWSGSYDQDLQDEWGYLAPDIAADALESVCADRDAAIVDLGCGTGLVGKALRQRGYRELDGLDVSTGMLEQARRKGVYDNLFRGDLTARTPLPSERYRAAVCVGSMGAGHVDASHLPELLRVVEPGGWLIVYMSGRHYVDEGFEAKFREHEREGRWRIERIEASNYMAALERPGRLLVGQKPGSD